MLIDCNANIEKLQWQTGYGLLENAVYGGRVDNEFDMKVLKTYLRTFFNPNVFAGIKLSGVVDVRSAQGLKDVLALVNKLPEQDNPRVFGLPSNIDRSVQRFNSQKVLLALKQLGRVSDQHMKFQREKWSGLLGPLWKLWQTLIKITEFRKIKIKVHKRYFLFSFFFSPSN